MYVVDLPDPKRVDEIGAPMVQVGPRFATREDAVQWIRDHIGPCDDDGSINLITCIG